MKRLALLALVLVLVLAACSAVPQTDLRRNQDKWQSSNIKDYRFSLFIGCFCGFTDRMPLSVEVRNGEMASMTYADGKPVAPDDMNFEYFNRFSTVDRLFADLQSGQASKADKIDITYDPTYGYPSQVNVDQIQNATDDEYSVQISNFQVLAKL